MESLRDVRVRCHFARHRADFARERKPASESIGQAAKVANGSYWRGLSPFWRELAPIPFDQKWG
jgi:hypothetical protein